MPISREYLHSLSWDEKAKANPLYAVMSVDAFSDAPPADFTPEQLEAFFAKGTDIVQQAIVPPIARTFGATERTLQLYEYGCGMGRLMRALEPFGYRVAGIDISPTMLEHARRFAPNADGFYAVGGRPQFPAASADVVYSYAVVQHIARLSDYDAALHEMARALRPGGLLILQANCLDFERGMPLAPWRKTVNLERASLHLGGPWTLHRQTQWSGVYIGRHRLARRLAQLGVRLLGGMSDPHKPRSVWFHGVKGRP